jgi:hypothetical protein
VSIQFKFALFPNILIPASHISASWCLC